MTNAKMSINGGPPVPITNFTVTSSMNTTYQARPKPLFVAEVKLKDPFAGRNFGRTFSELLHLAKWQGDIISVHTHPAWAGSLEQVEAAADTGLPVLAKGAHMFGFEFEAALAAGAKYVLTMNPDLAKAFPEQAWYEGPLNNLTRRKISTRVPWVSNSRSLVTGEKKRRFYPAFHVVRAVQASHIRTPEDVNPKFWAFIVGSHLEEFIEAKLATP